MASNPLSLDTFCVDPYLYTRILSFTDGSSHRAFALSCRALNEIHQKITTLATKALIGGDSPFLRYLPEIRNRGSEISFQDSVRIIKVLKNILHEKMTAISPYLSDEEAIRLRNGSVHHIFLNPLILNEIFQIDEEVSFLQRLGKLIELRCIGVRSLEGDEELLIPYIKMPEKYKQIFRRSLSGLTFRSTQTLQYYVRLSTFGVTDPRLDSHPYLQPNQLKILADFMGASRKDQLLMLSNTTKHIIASHHLLHSLPTFFGNLASLGHLSLSNTGLNSLPDSFGNLSSLEHLDLTMNHLVSLPQSFGNLHALKSCFLDNNSIEELPSSMGQLSSLTELSLFNNRLTSLPESLGNITTLVSLNIGYNPLQPDPTLPLVRNAKILFWRIFGQRISKDASSLAGLARLQQRGCSIRCDDDVTNALRRMPTTASASGAPGREEESEEISSQKS